MTVRALEVCAAGLDIWRDIPTAAALVGHQWEFVVIRDLLHKMSVGLDGTESVGDRQGRTTEPGESLGNGLFRRGEMKRGDGYGECVGHDGCRLAHVVASGRVFRRL